MPASPRQIARLISEDISRNNGLVETTIDNLPPGSPLDPQPEAPDVPLPTEGFDQAFDVWIKQNELESDWEQFKSQYGEDKWAYLNEMDAIPLFSDYCEHECELASDETEAGRFLMNVCQKCGR